MAPGGGAVDAFLIATACAKRSSMSDLTAPPQRWQNLLDLDRRIDRDNVRGAIVECGVLDGGTAASMASGGAAYFIQKP